MNINKHMIGRILLRNGYSDFIKIPFSKEELILVSEKYNGGYSIRKISETYGINIKRINYILEYLKIPINTRLRSRIYNLDEKYFDVIDNQNKAYWLGLLFADGYNNEINAEIKLALKEEDKYLLEQFSQDIKLDGELEERIINNRKYYVLHINSRHMSNKLKSYGCLQNKSLSLRFPKKIPKELIHHFIRGYFDGDGYVKFYTKIKNNKKYKGCIFAITSTKIFLDELKKILLHNTQLNDINIFLEHKNDEYNNNITSRLQYNGKNNLLKIFNYLYNDAAIYMFRKYNEFVKGLKI